MTEPSATWRVVVADADDVEVAAARLWQAGAVAVALSDTDVVGTLPADPDGRAPPSTLDLGRDVTWEHVPPVDHMAAWRAASVPVRAGAFELVPAHLRDEHTTPADVHRIVIDAGMAFGSGHHDTTAGCLDLLTTLPVQGRRILDVGTGTGILAIAAALVGAAEVVGVDTDPQAIEVAAANAAANDVGVTLTIGSTGVATGPFDGVLANLLTGLLVELAPDLAGLVTPGGWLVASGIGVARTPRVTAALTANGFVDVRVHHRGDWSVLVATRSGQTVPVPQARAPGDAASSAADPATRWPPHPEDAP